jgi:DNA polymerase-3 subunit delta'
MWDVIGHEAIVAALQRAVASGHPAHAWLFAGQEGLGKRTTALQYAAALNCVSASKPCGECKPCRDTLAGHHPDVEMVGVGSLCDESEHKDHADSRWLRICQVRRVSRVLSIAPYISGGRRVAVIDNADTMAAEAANAFLKTLEEPPEGSVIILLAERPERLPETVLSRCQRLDFRPVDRGTLHDALIARGADEATADAITATAGGRAGWALRAMEDPAMLDERGRVLEDAVRMAHAGRVARFAWAKDAAGRGADDARERYLRELAIWETWWRDVLLFAAGSSEGAINADRAAILTEEGKMYAPADIAAFLRTLIATREMLQANVDPQLALENLTLDLPRPAARTR